MSKGGIAKEWLNEKRLRLGLCVMISKQKIRDIRELGAVIATNTTLGNATMIS